MALYGALYRLKKTYSAFGLVPSRRGANALDGRPLPIGSKKGRVVSIWKMVRDIDAEVLQEADTHHAY